jgi:TonB family protein
MKAVLAAILTFLAVSVLAEEPPYQLRTGVTRAESGTFVVGVEVLSPTDESLFTKSVEMKRRKEKVATPYGNLLLEVDAEGRGVATLQIPSSRMEIIHLIELQPPAGYLRVHKEPRALNRVPPRFVAEAARRRVSGVAIVDALVNAKGFVDEVRVVRDPGYGLGAAAAEAVRLWQFEPAVVDGKPVAVAFAVSVKAIYR